jgi:uncharacterized membrane protein
MRRRFRLSLLALSFVLALAPRAPAQDEDPTFTTPTFTTIDPPDSDGTFTTALDVNSAGDIVGLYSTPDGHRHGFLRSKDGLFTRIDFPGGSITNADGINPRGDIVGHTLVKGKRHGYLRKKNGEFTQIDFPGAAATLAVGINPRGDIVGHYCIVTPPQCLNGNKNAHGFLLSAHGDLLSRGEFTTIDVPGALESQAYKINSRGQIVGSYFGADGSSHIFLLSEGEFTTIDAPGAVETPNGGTSAGISPRGDIVSSYCAALPLPCKVENVRGFLLSEGEFTAIDVPGAIGTGATGINARGDIVGFYNPDASHYLGFLRTARERDEHDEQ